MPRILLAGIFHETHTFLDATTGLADFQIRRGEELLQLKGDASPFGGVLDLAEEFGWEVLPVTDYRAQPSAIVEDAVIESFWNDFTALAAPHLEQPVDAVYLVLHGAMVSQSHDDVEGELLERLRALPGLETVPVFGVFDLHASFTARMARHADCLVAYRENPHTDAREAACQAARLLQRCLATGAGRASTSAPCPSSGRPPAPPRPPIPCSLLSGWRGKWKSCPASGPPASWQVSPLPTRRTPASASSSPPQKMPMHSSSTSPKPPCACASWAM
jgi:microcystin degradation protein MlrC